MPILILQEKNVPVGSPERAQNAWDFVGPPGRGKNVALYYLFLMLDGKMDTVGSTRKLDEIDFEGFNIIYYNYIINFINFYRWPQEKIKER